MEEVTGSSPVWPTCSECNELQPLVDPCKQGFLVGGGFALLARAARFDFASFKFSRFHRLRRLAEILVGDLEVVLFGDRLRVTQPSVEDCGPE
jgi:hypothetical protein